jgi:hypothetical protein
VQATIIQSGHRVLGAGRRRVEKEVGPRPEDEPAGEKVAARTGIGW